MTQTNGTPTGDETQTIRANRRLKPGTLVVSMLDGEPGRIVQVAVFRRNGVDAVSYEVETKYGREEWDASNVFVPENA